MVCVKCGTKTRKNKLCTKCSKLYKMVAERKFPKGNGEPALSNVLLVLEAVGGSTNIYLLEKLNDQEVESLVSLQGYSCAEAMSDDRRERLEALKEKLSARAGGAWSKFKQKDCFKVPPNTTFVWICVA